MPSVVSKLLVELDGRNDRLVAALGGSEDAMQKFRQSAGRTADALSAIDRQIGVIEKGASAGNANAVQALAQLQGDLKRAVDAGTLSLTEQIQAEDRLRRVTESLTKAQAAQQAPAKRGITSTGDPIATIERRIALLAQGTRSEATIADSLQRLIAVEGQLEKATQRGNLTLQERIALEQALGKARGAIQGATAGRIPEAAVPKLPSAPLPTAGVQAFKGALQELGQVASNVDPKLALVTQAVSKFSATSSLAAGAGAAAITIALGAIAVKAIESASAFDASFRRIAAVLPAGKAGLDQVKQSVEDLAHVTGRSQQELADAAAQIARLGVSGPDELTQRLRAVTTAADATGEDLQSLIGGLDQVLDTFNLTGADAERVLGNLFQAAKGRTTLADVFDTIQASAPSLRKLNIDLDQATRALVALGEEGKSPRQAAARLKELAEGGAIGRREIERLAASTAKLGGGFAELQRLALESNEAVENLAKRNLHDLAQQFLDLGRTIIPLATKALQGWNDVISLITGRDNDVIAQTQAASAAATLGNLNSFAARAAKQQQDGLQVFADAAIKLNALVVQGQGKLVATTAAQAQRLVTGANEVLKSGIVTEAQIAPLLNLLDQLAKKTEAAGKTPPKSRGVQIDIEATKQAAGAVQEVLSSLDGVRNSLRGLAASSEDDPIAKTAKQFSDLTRTLDELQKKLPKGEALLSIDPSERARIEATTVAIKQLRDQLDHGRSTALGEAQTKLFLDTQQAAADAIGNAAESATAKLNAELAKIDAAIAATRRANPKAEALPFPTTASVQIGALQQQRDELAKVGPALIQAQTLARRYTQEIATATSPLEKQSRLLAEQRNLQILADDALQRYGADSKVTLFYQDKLKDVTGQIASNTGENAKNITEAVKASDSFAQSLSEALSAAFGIASALLGADNVLTRMLGSSLHISEGLKNAGEAIGKLTNGKQGLSSVFSSGSNLLAALPGLGQAIGGAIGLLTDVAGLFGESAEDRARRAIIEKNTDALHELARTNGDLLNSKQALNTVAGVRGALDTALPATTDKSFTGGVIQRARTLADLGSALARAGLSMKDLRQTAEDLGITLSEKPTVAELKQLQEAIRKADLHLFFETFAGDLERLDANDKIHGITDPIDKLIERAELLAQKSPIFAEIFKGLDLTTVEGRVEAQRRLQQKWDELLADPEKFRAALEASGLSLEEFKAQMLSVNDALDEGAIAAKQFGDDLRNLQLKFKVNKTSFADQVPALEQSILGGSLGNIIKPFLEKTGGDWAQAFRDFVDAALADGVITEQEQAAIDAFQAVADAMDGAADAAKNAADQAKQEAEATRQATNARLDEQERINDFLGGHPQGGAKVQEDAQTLAGKSPAIRQLLSTADFSSAEGLQRFNEALKQLIRDVLDGKIPIEQFGTLTKDEFIDACIGMGDAAVQAASSIRSASQTLLDVVNDVDHEGHVLGLDKGTVAQNEFNAAVGASPSIKSFIGGFDPTTPEGRKAIVAGLRTLWGHIKNNPNDSIDGQPGSAIIGTVEHLIDTFSGFDDTGNAGGAPSSGGGGGATEVHGVVQTATIGQADQMIGLQTTQVSLLSQIRDALRTAFLLGAPTALRPPVIPPQYAGTNASLAAAVAAAQTGAARAQTVLAFSADFSGGIEVKSLEELSQVLTRRFLDAFIQAIGQRGIESLYNKGGFRPAAG